MFYTIWFVHISGEKNSQGNSRLFRQFFLPETFVRKLIRIICACSVNQLIRPFCFPWINSTSGNLGRITLLLMVFEFSMKTFPAIKLF